MEGTLPETEFGAAARHSIEDTAAPDRGADDKAYALALGDLLREHRGADVVTLDLREMNAWTDFFVIATAGSSAHLDGLERHIKEFCRERGLEILRRSRKPAGEDDEWRLIDLGSIVVHLMSGRMRAFYELERLYGHSSKSS
jgi:ribosome-associated protein